MRKSVDDSMRKAGKAEMASILLAGLMIPVRPWMFVTAWEWHAVPLGAPELNYLHGWVAMMVAALLRTPSKAQTVDAPERLGVFVVRPWLTFGALGLLKVLGGS